MTAGLHRYLDTKPVIFVACKRDSESALRGLVRIVKWIQRHGPQSDIHVDVAFQRALRHHSCAPSIRFIDPVKELLESDPNLLITCGGDGTLLRAAAHFQDRSPPPIVSFSLGSLGFLSSFDFFDYRMALTRLFKGRLGILERTRLTVELPKELSQSPRQVLNEILLSRHCHNTTRSSDAHHLPQFGIAAERDMFAFPLVVADGLMLATATGSTGHSLSAHGPIIHPSLESAVVLNAIAPRTLGFRPLVMSCSMPLRLGLTAESRSESVEIVLDGQPAGLLHRDQTVNVQKSAWPVPVFNMINSNTDWNRRLSFSLRWAHPYRSSRQRTASL